MLAGQKEKKKVREHFDVPERWYIDCMGISMTGVEPATFGLGNRRSIH